jgi:acetylornithine deacetylase/succinyl-diaminopimelate desuccinylase-like protein
VHAGRLGGAVVDPSQILSRLHLRAGGALPTLCALPRQTDPAGPRRIRTLDDAAVRRRAPGRATWPAGLDRRITRGAALTVVGVELNAFGAAVPSRAVSRWDLRLPPGCNVKLTLDRLIALCRSAADQRVRVEVSLESANAGFSAQPPPGILAAIDRASLGSFGCPAALVRSGGSLPAATLLHESFGVTPVLLGLGTAGGRAHAPDEHLDLAGWHRCVELVVRLLGDLADPLTSPGRSHTETRRHVRSPKGSDSLSASRSPLQDDEG